MLQNQGAFMLNNFKMQHALRRVHDACKYLQTTNLTLPNDNFLNWAKLKAFADDKMNVSQKLKFYLERIENTLENGVNAGDQHFLLFPQCFLKLSSSKSLKIGFVW